LGFTAGLRALGIAALAAASFATVAAPSAAAATPSISTSTTAVRVVQVAEQQRGKRYVFGAAGPSAFDCSGLVVYAYRRAGVATRLGGGHSGYGMLAWARAHHRFSRSNPQVGDVVIYGGGAHVGIYIGNGKVISALNPSQGIRVTGLHALHSAVTGYIHTQLGKAAPAAPVAAHAAVRLQLAGPIVKTVTFSNLRAGASTASRLLAVVRPGVGLRLIGTATTSGKRWDHVVYLGHTYWVRSDLVRAG
jgi:cell wall-associated NlpC family hydrolase